MAAWPKRKDELYRDGYAFEGMSICKGRRCRAQIYWWRTPNNKRIPLVHSAQAGYQPHFADCPDWEDRKR